MKIEMLEQAIASYLKNVEGCLMVQTNWTPSFLLTNSITEKEYQKLNRILNEISDLIPTNDIQKKSTVEQFVSQCEIDIVGFKKGPNRDTIYLYDTAFHEYGLNYKDTDTTVLKKIVRAFFIGKLFFEGYDIRVGFVSPKCSPKVYQSIIQRLGTIIYALNQINPNAKVDILIGDACIQKIKELNDVIDLIADDNDLYVRAVKLYKITLDNQKVNSTNANATSVSNQIKTKGKNKEDVMNAINELISSNNKKILAALTDEEESQKLFGLSYPVIIKASAIDDKNQVRFYPEIINIDGELYRVCSQWIPEKKEKLLKWKETVI